ncbi:MAG: NAD(P)H-hydrate dehydratase [Novosphingobium sp.]|nr:NAD(P)H-hydrate dehydratase [Novosphingobium sp.]
MKSKTEVVPLDSDWLRAYPLPEPAPDTDKNGRGRVMAIGGCTTVPGGLLLTAEAALRAGAGKMQIATIQSVAMLIGLHMPEAAVIALEQTEAGEIAKGCAEKLRPRLARTDAVIAGPAMGCADAAAQILGEVLELAAPETVLIVDAAALTKLEQHRKALRERPQPALLTPHIGEIAAMLGMGAEAIDADRESAVRQAADHFNAVCVLKGARSLIAAPDGALFAFAGGGVGLATGGSGDVLAGIAAGLAARGASPLDAALWAVWLHGEAGRRCAETEGPVGFLARELLAHVPRLMRGL